MTSRPAGALTTPDDAQALDPRACRRLDRELAGTSAEILAFVWVVGVDRGEQIYWEGAEAHA